MVDKAYPLSRKFPRQRFYKQLWIFGELYNPNITNINHGRHKYSLLVSGIRRDEYLGSAQITHNIGDENV